MNETPAIQDDALKVFWQFYREMSEWLRISRQVEGEFGSDEESRAFTRERLASLIDIFDRFVIYTGYPMRSGGAEEGFGYDPREYDKETERITAVEEGRKYVYINTVRGIDHFRYTLVRKPEGWRLKDGRHHWVNGVDVGMDWL